MVTECHTCNGEAAGYRCPSCRILYCSSRCYKIHQHTHSAVSAKQHSPRAERQSPTKLQLASHDMGLKLESDTSTITPQIQSLGQIKLYNDIRSIITLYPSLRGQLKEIYNATLEAGNEEQYSGKVRARPGHSKWRRKASHRTGTPQGCWTPAEGFSQALYRYRKAIEREDEMGDAMRAFSGLIIRSNTQTTKDTKSKDQGASGSVTELGVSNPVFALLDAI